MRHVYLGRNSFRSKKKMQLSKKWKLKLLARTCSQQQCWVSISVSGTGASQMQSTQNRIVPSWMKDFKALPHFNVVIVLSFTGVSLKLNHSVRSCKRNEFVNKSWHRNSRCLGISQTTYGIWVDLVKTTGDRGIFQKNTFKVLPFPNHHSCSL